MTGCGRPDHGRTARRRAAFLPIACHRLCGSRRYVCYPAVAAALSRPLRVTVRLLPAVCNGQRVQATSRRSSHGIFGVAAR